MDIKIYIFFVHIKICVKIIYNVNFELKSLKNKLEAKYKIIIINIIIVVAKKKHSYNSAS